jgi:arsenate reductase
VITVFDDANERCPFLPGSVKRLHWSLEDPSRVLGDEETRLAAFRRGEIETRVTEWLAAH